MPLLQSVFSHRLVQLCDGRPGLRGCLNVDIHEPGPAGPAPSPGGAPNPDSAVLDFIASSETLDRYDEILTADGWQLDNYRRNPVFQNAHQYGDIIFTLGKALLTEVRTVAGRRVLFQRVEFATDINPMAKIAYGLYRGKFLNAVSVGFIPLRWENGGAEAGFRRKYLEQELLEVSAVGIPANPDALQLALKAGAIDKGELRELAELIRLALDGLRPAGDSACESVGPGSITASSPRPSPPGEERENTSVPATCVGPGSITTSSSRPSPPGEERENTSVPATFDVIRTRVLLGRVEGNSLLRLARELRRLLAR